MITEAAVIVCSSLVERHVRSLAPKGKEIVVDNKRIDQAGIEMLRSRLMEMASGDRTPLSVRTSVGIP
jgi:hypothetical protein